MANTVHGPYSPTNWTGTTGISTAQLNRMETGPATALHSFNPYLVTAAYISSGVACVKDTTTASQLNVTSGEAFLIMSDGTLALIDVAAITFSASGHASSTLYLDLNPDGTWSFATTHSAQTNYLPICQVTTDGSSNISGVTDKRVTLASLLSGSALPAVGQPGGLALPSPVKALLTQSAANAATVNGGVTFGQTGALRGSMDTAALFNGTTGYISVPTSGLPTGAGQISLECWLYMTAYPASGANVVTVGSASSNSDFTIQVSSTGLPGVANFGTAANGSTPLSLNAWHHLVGTWDGTTMRCYADGTLAASGTPTGMTITYGSATIGSFLTGASAFFGGYLDEVAIYNTALSATRISAHISAQQSATSDAYASTVLADAPLRYYRLGDAVGATSAACTITPTATTVVDAAGDLNVPGSASVASGVTATMFTAAQAAATGALTGLQIARTAGTVKHFNVYIDGSNNFGIFDVEGNGAVMYGNASALYANFGGGPLSAAGSTSAVTLSGTPADIPGFTLTLATAGTYLVIGSVYCDIGGSGTSGSAVIYLSVNGTRQNLTGELSMATTSTNMTLNANVTQTWVVTVGAGQVVKLQASGANGFANVSPNGGTVASSLVAQYLHS